MVRAFSWRCLDEFREEFTGEERNFFMMRKKVAVMIKKVMVSNKLYSYSATERPAGRYVTLHIQLVHRLHSLLYKNV